MIRNGLLPGWGDATGTTGTDALLDGFIEATPNEIVDYDRIRARIIELQTQYDIQEITFDRWNVTQLAIRLTDQGD